VGHYPGGKWRNELKALNVSPFALRDINNKKLRDLSLSATLNEGVGKEIRSKKARFGG